MAKFTGASIKRKEDPRLITGKGTYVDDVRLQGMLYMAILRSIYSHARIKTVDVSEAKRHKGVLAAITGEEVARVSKPLPCAVSMPGLKVPKRYALAVGKVHHVGEPLAAVVAADRYVVRDALDLIEVDYEPLPAVVDIERALGPGAPIIHEEWNDNVAYYQKTERGNVEKAFKEADLIVKERLVIPRLAPVSMETRGIVADYEPVTGSLTVWLSTQNPHVTRTKFSDYFGIPEHKIRVIAPDVGGAFGSKISYYSEEVLACLLSMRLSRPVKWIEERRENLLATNHGRGHVHYVEVAAKKDGKVLGLKDKIIADCGAYMQLLTPSSPLLTVLMLPGNYKISNIFVELYEVFTNKMATDPYRGAGRPEATYIVERVMDMIARELKLDPADVRLKNFVQPAEFPFTSVTGMVYDSGNYPEGLKKALEISGYSKLREEQKRLRKEGKYMGIGIASYVEVCGFGPSKEMPERWGGYEGATVRVSPGGKVTVFTGTSGHGQGHETPFAQIAADELGVKPEDVTVVHGDTGVVQYGMGTYGSRSLVLGGTAILMAAKKVKEKAIRIAGQLLRAGTEEIEFSGGRFYVKGSPHRALTIEEIADEAIFMKRLPSDFEPGLEATSFYEPSNTTYPFGVHVAVVEVEVETGEVKINKYFAVDDCGRVINPMMVDGQIHGGVAQGIGQALYEEVIYDENGQLLTSTLMDYFVPTALEIPNFITDRTETPSPINPLGAKGVGEAGTIVAPPVIVNAVEDALAPFGVRIREMPLKPEYIWRLIKEGQITDR